jgi:hypothetical protein
MQKQQEARAASKINAVHPLLSQTTVLPLPFIRGEGRGEGLVPRAVHGDGLLFRALLAATILFVILGSAIPSFAEAQPPSAAHSFIIGVSPFLEKSSKDDVFRGIVRLLVEDLPLDSTLEIYDAFELKTITRVYLPNARVFNSPKTRANQFSPAILELKKFLAREHVPPTNSHLKFQAAIRVPQFLDFLGETTRATNSAAIPAVLLLGSPLYQDAKEPGFSMVDGYYPSDGHLMASREKSVFGITSKDASLPMRVHWAYFGDPWLSDLHKEQITRFWTLYLGRRSADLAIITGDLASAVRSFRQENSRESNSKLWALDKSQTKIEMLRSGRSVELTDWLTRETLPDAAPPPPTHLKGVMKIGIRWKSNIDLDLYATPHSGAETLYFEHLRSPEGYYYKDHRSSPGREYEFIEFERPVDIRHVEAFVNFYKGNCPGGPRGEVRIEFEGRIYSGTFSLGAEEGNQGRTGSGQSEYWTRIPLKELLLGTTQARLDAH